MDQRNSQTSSSEIVHDECPDGGGTPVVSRRGMLAASGLAVGAVVGATLTGVWPSAAKAIQPEDSPRGGRTSKAILADLEKAYAGTEGTAIEKLCEELWASDRAQALATFTRMVGGERLIDRPVGAAMLARRAEGPELVKVINGLNGSRFAIERRYLTRFIGKTKTDDVYAAALKLLGDNDLDVRIAACAALAEIGRGEAIGQMLTDLRQPPAESADFDDGDGARFSAARYGFIYSVAGMRFKSGAEVSGWWKSTGPKPPARPARSESFKTDTRGGRKYWQLPSFDYEVRLGGLAREATPTGDLAPERVAQWSEAAVKVALDRVRQVFGPVVVPPVRLAIADDQQFSSVGDNTFFDSASTGNAIALRQQSAPAMQALLTEEYFRVAQMLACANWERWALVGPALSVVRFPKAPAQYSVKFETIKPDPSRIPERLRLKPGDGDKAGPLSILLWTKGEANSAQEVNRYRKVTAVFNWFRSPRFSFGDTRVAFLLGATERKVDVRSAVRDYFGYDAVAAEKAIAEYIK